MSAPHVGLLRFYSPLNAKERKKWGKLIKRKDFKVTASTKVCSNHFAVGYRSKECPNPTLYMTGYEVKEAKKRLPPKHRSDIPSRSKKRKREVSETRGEGDEAELSDTLHDDINTEVEKSDINVDTNKNVKMEQQADPSDINDSSLFEDDERDECFCNGDIGTLKRKLFVDQATNPKKCYRYTGLSREKLDLVFSFAEEKAKSLRCWRGSTDTPPSRAVKRGHVPRLLTRFEEFILTLVRTRKGFDITFLADTFEISASQVSRIYTTWVIFLSNELSFLVPWPSKMEIQEKLPKRFKKFKNLRIIIDCAEFYIQKPKIPESQKITWSSYKQWNTAKLLIGITPTGVISFVPPLWTGSVSD